MLHTVVVKFISNKGFAIYVPLSIDIFSMDKEDRLVDNIKLKRN